MPEELLEQQEEQEEKPEGETPEGETPEGEEEGEGGKGGGDLRVALRKEREKRQALAKKVEQLQPLVDEYQSILPLLPKLLEQQNRQERAQAQEAQDAELVAVAQALGFETEDGKPDVARAKAVVELIDRRSGRVAQRTVAPAQAAAQQALIADLKERAYKATHEDGTLYAKREVIDQVFSALPPEALTNPDNVIAALVMARGLGGPGGEPTPSEPVFSETVSARRKVKREASGLEKSIAEIRGWDKNKLSKVVEDDLDYSAPLE